jgi:hypothetical protein
MSTDIHSVITLPTRTTDPCLSDTTGLYAPSLRRHTSASCALPRVYVAPFDPSTYLEGQQNENVECGTSLQGCVEESYWLEIGTEL